MKRFIFAALFSALFACGSTASMEPPVPVLEGLQVFGPSGVSTGAVLSVTNMAPVSVDTQPEEGSETETNTVILSIATGLHASLPLDTSDRISELARALDNNYLLCYSFVRDNIKYTPYRGIVKGPVRTLIDREGNDADQAFLLYSLLTASGYTATVCYWDLGEFFIPLADGQFGYDAMSLLGIPDDNLGFWDYFYEVIYILGPSGILYHLYQGSTPQTSWLSIEHFAVYLYDEGGYYLDPSIKPSQYSAADSSISLDMGYVRSNLLSSVGGYYTNNWFVQGLSSTALTNELCNMTANIISSVNGSTIENLIGYSEIIPQDFSTADTNFYHGIINAAPINFLSLSNSEKSQKRTQLTVFHGGITNNCWIDDMSGRNLWISYTNSPGYSYPKAVLHLDDSIIAIEDFGSQDEHVAVAIGIYHQSVTNWVFDSYALKRSVTNVYSIPVGFGSICPEGMRTEEVFDLSELSCADNPDSIEARAAVLNSLGHQWLYQCAMLNSLLSSIGGYKQYTLFKSGVVGHESASYFDFKTGASFTSRSSTESLYSGYVFSSALEHSVLDQNNGIDRPAVSTVRIIDLANNDGTPIYLASSNEWSFIKNMLTGYSTDMLDWIEEKVNDGQRILLPQSGDVTLNDWSGCGFFLYGPKGVGSLLKGELGGGVTSLPGYTLFMDILRQELSQINESAVIEPTQSADPVDMCEGAAVIDRIDLSLKGPSPLSWKRHYDSRKRFSNGSAGRGWSHGYDSRITVHSDPDICMGRGTPASCAASIVACVVVDDLLKDENARNVSTACLVAKWWTDQLYNSTASITADGRSLSFSRLPDGTYEPQPGVTASLTGSETSGFTLTERLGSTWNFNTNGVLSEVEDRSGNTTSFTYTNGTSLVSVANDFGAQLSIDWTGDKITSVSDNAGRSLSYTYSAEGCLTGVTDVAGYTWAMSYNDEGSILSETDSEGIVTLQNTYNGLGQVTNQLSASGNHWIFAYADGWRSWEADPLLNRVHYGFTDEGHNSWRQDRDGAFHQFFYDSCGHLVTNIDAIGRTHISAYDSDNHLLSVTEAANTPDSRTTSFAYDAQHHLIATTNALGRIIRMGYDSRDRLALLTTPDGVSVTNTYNAKGLLITSKTFDSGGETLRESSFAYNSRGLPEERTSTDAGTTAFSHDSAGNVTGVTDALGNATAFAYDPRGFATNTINALGHSATTLLSATGRPVTTTDPLGRTTAFQWTPGGKPAAVIFPDGGVLTNSYDAADRLSSVTDTRDTTIAFNLDAVGRATNRVAATWSDYIWYDAAGVVTTLQDAVSGRTQITSDWLDRPVALTDPLGRTHTTRYDPLNAVTNTLDPRGRLSQYSYDTMGRLTRATRPSGYAESYGHDALGRTVAFTNAEGRVTTLTYDAQNRLLTTVNAAGDRLFLNRYDNLGNLTNRLDGAGNSTVYQYDALNRNISVTYADDITETFTYDAANNLTSADNGVISNTFVYDNMNRLVGSGVRWQEPAVNFQTAYRYDIGGLVTNIVYPGNKTLYYAYDTDGRLTSVTDWNNRTFTFTRDAAGRRTALAYPNGVIATNTYDAAHNLTSWRYSKSGSTLTGRTINRDAVGHKTSESVTSGLFPNPTQPRRASNTFDAADRLTSAIVHSGTNTFNETYSYNANGALTNSVRTLVSGVNYQATYTYDLAGRFTSAALTNTLTHTHTDLNIAYDALGNRLRTVRDETVRLWVTDHADPVKRPLMETDASGTPVRYYLWGGGQLLAVIDADGGTRYAHTDEFGSVVALSDNTGAVTDQFSYGPHGENWGRTGTTDIPFRWLGSHGVYNLSGTSLHLTRYRAYDSNTTRFLSSDPLGLGGGPNLYSYCLGNPLSYIDTLGLCGEDVSYGFGFIDYAIDVDNFLIGEADAVISAIEGTAYFLMNPSEATMAAMDAIAYLDYTISDYTDSISTAWKDGSHGQGQVVGGILVTAFMVAAPYSSGVLTAPIGVSAPNNGLGSNPFKGMTFKQIDEILTKRKFKKIGPDPSTGAGKYVHPKTGRTYRLDKAGKVYKKTGKELPHVDVDRLKSNLQKKKYPLGDTLNE